MNASHEPQLEEPGRSRQPACACLFFALAVLIGLITGANSALADDFDEGFEAASNGNHELAIHFYTKAIRSGDLTASNLAYAYNNRGYSFEQLGDYEASIRDYSTAIQQKPDYVQAFENRGIVYFLSGASKSAISDFDQVLRLDPDHVNALLSRAQAYRFNSQFTRALEDISAYIDKRPSDALGYLVRGNTSFMLGRFPEATDDYGTSLEIGWDQGPPQIYAELWMFLARERIGEDGKSRLEAVAKQMDEQTWPAPVVLLFLGKTGAEEVLATIRTGDQFSLLERECEAFFYLGQYELLNRNRKTAADYFQRTIATGVSEFVEYEFAKAELERLYPLAPDSKLKPQ